MIIGYLRVSTEKQHLENQQDEIDRYAKENDMVVDRWVTEVVSGKKEVKGRKLGRTISRMKRGDTLIVSEVSRLSRNLTDIMTLGRPKGSSPKFQILIDNEEEILSMLDAGTSVRSICRHFKVSKGTWYKYRKERLICPHTLNLNYKIKLHENYLI